MKSFSTLQIALGVSAAVHAALLTVRLVDPEGFNRVFQDTPLEVVLVNAASHEKPEKAQAIAQRTLAGGGEAARGRATSPLPPSALTEIGDAAEDAHRRIEAMQDQQMLMLAQVKRMLAALPPADPKQASTSAEAQAREEKRRRLSQLLAEIERRINEENARPKKRYISPSTREEVYAVYYDGLRRKIEERGTTNFPELGGRKLYGELTMIVTVNHDGSVLGTEVVESSGNATLDRRAQAIAKQAGPFGRFNTAMRQRADQIVVVSRFKFNRDETLETRLTSP
ncbi:TonB family protein [Ramlibacter tataouinensis]|uniref:TonB family protein n=1 Tax=Ramlibacter tataouinensis TaxID=94132 RepID=UPI0022F3C064|nr:TonB family protein [Ramlibacter tataouinensis]WBY04033.1 TonB family protein [Ramlibacter tataouinensis]